MNLSNVQFIHGRCPDDFDLNEKYGFIMARLAIYCSPDKDKLLAWARNALKDNSRIGIIDLDYDWIYSYPDTPLIKKNFNVHRKEFEQYGADYSIGKNFPLFLEKPGLKRFILK
ncbi:MAG TPA: hypothetical protein DD381_10900 [Lentisphaeria bacterium]|nr:MAG: hypothetical protein A2X47_00700 [Lentisphaerae bacterium GWF2_38_69]HBM16835.1 hypothetical protein [Lentisphaeria bacterium]